MKNMFYKTIALSSVLVAAVVFTGCKKKEDAKVETKTEEKTEKKEQESDKKKEEDEKHNPIHGTSKTSDKTSMEQAGEGFSFREKSRHHKGSNLSHRSSKSDGLGKSRLKDIDLI